MNMLISSVPQYFTLLLLILIAQVVAAVLIFFQRDEVSDVIAQASVVFCLVYLFSFLLSRNNSQGTDMCFPCASAGGFRVSGLDFPVWFELLGFFQVTRTMKGEKILRGWGGGGTILSFIKTLPPGANMGSLH